MAEDDERRRAFEARFLELKHKMEAGLLTRAHTLREAVQRLLAGDESARRTLKHEGHKLRGIAGSYGHRHITELAAELEQRASLSPPPLLEELATRLAHAAEEVGQRSVAAQSSAAAATPATPGSSGVMPAASRANHTSAATSGNAGSSARPAASSSGKRRAAGARPAITGSHGGALRVLAMDDDATTLKLLRLTLGDIGGFDSTIVTSGREALNEMRLREFDVIVSDAMMPDMNGKEFCAAARTLGGYAEQVPIIILSAATQDELRWTNELIGPVSWLRKPFIPTALVKDIAKIVDQHRRAAAARSG